MIRKVNVDIAQYLMRQAFEEGYLAARGDRGVYSVNPKKGKWFDHWILCKTRQMLVDNGVISGQEDYR